jgi:hypothetical protein
VDLHFNVNGGTLNEGKRFKSLIKHKQTNKQTTDSNTSWHGGLSLAIYIALFFSTKCLMKIIFIPRKLLLMTNFIYFCVYVSQGSRCKEMGQPCVSVRLSVRCKELEILTEA